MFKHLLLPTDGSELSAAAIREGIRFAKSIAAKVTGFCVMPMQKQRRLLERPLLGKHRLDLLPLLGILARLPAVAPGTFHWTFEVKMRDILNRDGATF